eukprot:CAMPEP_0181319410 /NCGR_PEP_ID=MMETSP1101-20121128/17556_1 /TAXON_ID=46948 /ORGANISM="Rhodomonas abbreviata, Strain Caron Lab Isolate" /LENGTH=884 /DNA_ID=CAMNT_0023427007 /DNA_START=300 /DNA_END=2950 /DNA_ORIENTATION=-
MKASKVVTFGDCVCLVVPDLGGLVASDAHITSTVYVDRREGFDATVLNHDQHRARFFLTPKLSYSTAKAVQKHSKQQRKPDGVLPQEAAAVERLLADERASNAREAARANGQVVHYGSIVQIQDASGKFLTQVKNISQKDATAMETRLSAHGEEGSWWKMVAADAVRSDGEPVRYSDRVWLQSVKYHNCFLSVCASSPLLDRDAGTPQSDFVRLHPGCSQRFETNASARARKFQILPLRAAPNKKVAADKLEQHLVRGFDVVTFHQRQNDSFLCAVARGEGSEGAGSDEAPSDQGSGRTVEWVGREDRDGRWQESLWRVTKLALQNGGETLKAGSEAVLLQHLTSGLYLQQQPGKDGWGPSRLGLTLEVYSEGCLWMVESDAEDSHTIANADCVWLRTATVNNGPALVSWLASGDDMDTEGGSAHMRLPGMEASSSAPSRHSAGQPSCCTPLLTPALEDRVAVVVSVVEAGLAAKVEYMVDALHVLSGLRRSLEATTPMAISSSSERTRPVFDDSAAAAILQQFRPWAEAALQQLICGCSRSDDSEALTREGPPLHDHQHLLRQVGLLDCSQHLILAIFQHLDLSQVAFTPIVQRLCKLLYRLLRQACVQNRENKLSLLSFVPHMRAHRDVQIGADLAMAEVYSETPEILRALGAQELEELLGMMRERQSESAVLLVLQCCHVLDKPLRNNQDRIAEWLLAHMDAVPEIHVGESDVTLSFPRVPEVGVVSANAILQQGEEEVLGSEVSGIGKAEQCFRFALKLFELFGRLVMGWNEGVRSKLLARQARLGIGLVSLQRMMACKEAPWCLRAVAADLILRLYVEAPPRVPVPLLIKTRVLRFGPESRGSRDSTTVVCANGSTIEAQIVTDAQHAALGARQYPQGG